MPEWSSPVELEKDGLVFIRLNSLVAGVMIWDCVSTLEYEWGVWLGQRKYLWTIWLYSSCRFLLFIFSALMLIAQATIESNCTVLALTIAVVSYLNLSITALLLALRTIAVWERRRIVLFLSHGLVAVCFCVNLGSLALDARVLQVIKSGTLDLQGCSGTKTNSRLAVVITVLGTDGILIGMMMTGLVRMPKEIRRGIIKHLYMSGLLWMMLVVAVEVPVFVLNVLDLNGTMNDMLSSVAIAGASICATRLYRSLAEWTHDIESVNVPVTMESMHFQTREETADRTVIASTSSW
ncbi:unnamed protein product [Peniophora sp. CBMAI 1063]|nr:unnamed protein product [Peniophora sp. CBMAI 1063]